MTRQRKCAACRQPMSDFPADRCVRRLWLGHWLDLCPHCAPARDYARANDGAPPRRKARQEKSMNSDGLYREIEAGIAISHSTYGAGRYPDA